MESKCFYCPNDVVSVAMYVVVGGKTYPVCDKCNEQMEYDSVSDEREDVPSEYM